MPRELLHTLIGSVRADRIARHPGNSTGDPDFDSAALCEELAGDKSEVTIRGCRFAEDYGLSELETFWPTTSAAIRERCIEQLQEQSYAELARCVLRLRRAR